MSDKQSSSENWTLDTLKHALAVEKKKTKVLKQALKEERAQKKDIEARLVVSKETEEYLNKEIKTKVSHSQVSLTECRNKGTTSYTKRDCSQKKH